MPRIAVITPYFEEPLEKIRRCHDSVLAQRHLDIQHLLIADGRARSEIGQWNALHVPLPHVGDIGNTPRMVGSVLANALGFDAIVQLDADNWLEAGHVEALLQLQAETHAAVLTSPRLLRRLDGSVLDVCRESNGEDFADPNGMMFMREAFPLLSYWGFGGALQDRVMWAAIVEQNIARAHGTQATVNYETTVAMHYLERGETPPANAKVHVSVDGVWQRMAWTEYQRQLALQSPQI